jgi:UDP-N-acetylmuramoyl-tripeptide--D-alanyl-D-alanine ligase
VGEIGFLPAIVLPLQLVGLVAIWRRWLYVAQREHYLPGSTIRFAFRWSVAGIANVLAAVLLTVLALAAWAPAPLGVVSAAVLGVIAAFWPFGLSAKGMAWTARVKRLAGLAAAGAAVFLGLTWWWLGVRGLLAGLAAVTLGSDLVMDLAMRVAWPIERRLQRQWVEKARTRLRQVGPGVVAITGSYGKTTAKEYVRRTLGLAGPTMASPASFNNAMGLSRAVNEHLAPGTKWFVAEMGAYGPGEVRAMCEWLPPDIAAITAIGPVHLERFGSLDVTLSSKAEIFERARVAVVNADDERLAAHADVLEASGKRVIRCGTTPGLDVTVSDAGDSWTATIDGTVVEHIPKVPFATNLAVALGIGLAADVPPDGLAGAFAGAETPEHRQSIVTADGGFSIIDNTFNSNPAGAASSLALLGAFDGRKVVVTPGMVELGNMQAEENRAFGAAASRVADDVVVVKRTNRRALLEGAAEGSATVHGFPDRDTAVAWVRAHLGPGDAVLYENDLPGHYP